MDGVAQSALCTECFLPVQHSRLKVRNMWLCSLGCRELGLSIPFIGKAHADRVCPAWLPVFAQPLLDSLHLSILSSNFTS